MWWWTHKEVLVWNCPPKQITPVVFVPVPVIKVPPSTSPSSSPSWPLMDVCLRWTHPRCTWLHLCNSPFLCTLHTHTAPFPILWMLGIFWNVLVFETHPVVKSSSKRCPFILSFKKGEFGWKFWLPTVEFIQPWMRILIASHWAVILGEDRSYSRLFSVILGEWQTRIGAKLTSETQPLISIQTKY